MKTRKLGNLEVSEIGAGCMSISANYGPPADRGEAAVAALASRSADFRSLDCNAARARSSALLAAGLRPFESGAGCATEFCRRLEAVWAFVTDAAMSRQAMQGKPAAKSLLPFRTCARTLFDSLYIDNLSRNPLFIQPAILGLHPCGTRC